MCVGGPLPSLSLYAPYRILLLLARVGDYKVYFSGKWKHGYITRKS